MGLKVFSIKEWLASHILFVGGLVLVTVGLLQGVMVLNILGIWAFALGLCLGFGVAFKKLAAK
jgi:uncharacterized membrane protein YiaA